MGDILDKKKDDLELTQFATLPAIRGSQFGKDVYSSIVKFNDLNDFFSIFPDVQRDIMPRKVASIRRYILSGLENREPISMRFFSAITVTCKATIFYDEKNSRCAIDTHASKLSINDGQHRVEAVRTTIDYLEREFLKSKDKEKTAKIKSMIDYVKEMSIPVIIFDDLSESEERMLFHDLNNLAQRPSRNTNIRFNQTDMFSKLARDLASRNRYLSHYGVEMDKMSISGNTNTNTILLSTIYESAKEILGAEYKYNRNFITDDNYEHYKEMLNDVFKKLFTALPHDIDIRGKYLIEKSFSIKAIARFICHARNHLDLMLSDEDIFKAIGGVDWTYNVEYWSKYNGSNGTGNNIVFAGGGSGGFRAVYNALMGEVAKR